MSVTLNGRTIRGVLFDKDGTLLDFERTFGPATADVLLHLADGDKKLCDRLARAVEFDLVTQTFAHSSVVIAGSQNDIVDALVVELDNWEPEALRVELDRKAGIATLEHLAPFDGVSAMLEILKALDLPIGLATNDAEINGRLQLKAMKIDHLFDCVFGYDSGHGAKPGPGMVLAFASAIGATGSEILMVGDTNHDGDAARAGGAIFAAVAPASSSDTLPADVYLAQTGDLGGLLESQNPEKAVAR